MNPLKKSKHWLSNVKNENRIVEILALKVSIMIPSLKKLILAIILTPAMQDQ